MATNKREVYLTKINTELSEVSTKLSILEAASRKAVGNADFDYDTRLSDLRKQRDAIREQITTLKERQAPDWESTQAETQAAIADLGHDLDDAMMDAGLTSEQA